MGQEGNLPQADATQPSGPERTRGTSDRKEHHDGAAGRTNGQFKTGGGWGWRGGFPVWGRWLAGAARTE